METDKIKTTKVKKETISGLHNKLKKGILIYFLIILFLFIGAFVFVNKQISIAQEESSEKQIISAVKSFNSMLSEKVSIIAASDIFLDYLHAGQITRKHIYPDFLLEMSLLDPLIFVGAVIEDSSGKIIFDHGTHNSTFISIKVCYLDNQLNSILGVCNYRWRFFINPDEYVKSFLFFHKDIALCENCKKINLLSEKNFGIFNVYNASRFMFGGKVASLSKEGILKYFLLICLIFIFFYFWMKKYIEKIIFIYIENPVRKLTFNLEKNQVDNCFDYPLEELDYMSKKLNWWRKECVKFEECQREIDLGRLSAQVAHDIRSPLAAISMLAESCKEIPETQRICLREAINRMQDIANGLLAKHNKREIVEVDQSLAPMLLSTAILEVISSKRLEFKNTNIQIHTDISAKAYFGFILANITEFKRMLSNLLNNAREASSDAQSDIFLHLSENNNHWVIAIKDSGCGMDEEKIQRLLSDDVITSNKEKGHGLGLTHLKETLKKMQATWKIHSGLNQGTTVELLFEMAPTPEWIANEIQIHAGDIIIILDDDSSIHGAWNEIFSALLKENPLLSLKHFTQASACIDYIRSCENPEKLLLLTDYELIGQSMNGLDVIEKTQAQCAILVTSHYENQEVIQRVNLLNTKILPKMLASHVKLTINNQKKDESSELIKIDLILLDDCQSISMAVMAALGERPHKIYNSPYALLEEIDLYHKDTKICTDYLLNSSMNGLDIAKILHEKGFSHLYMATGYPFQPGELPEYLHLLENKLKILEL